MSFIAGERTRRTHVPTGRWLSIPLEGPKTRPRSSTMDDHQADDLLKRALIEPEASAAVALRVQGLPLCDAVTVVFHGRRDLSTIQTYVTLGERGAGDAVSPSDLMRVPCDLDLAGAEDRDEAEHMYAEQAAAFRDALAA